MGSMLQDAENVDLICLSLFFQWTQQCCFLQALLRVGRKMQLWRNFFLNISQTFLPCGSCTGSILVDSLVLLPLPIVTRGLYTLQHCTTALALACGGKKIGWRAIPQMFTSPTCPQAFRLVTYLSFLFFLFQIQIQIHTNTNTHANTVGILGYWLVALRISQHPSSSLSWSASNMLTTWINH